MSDESLTPGRPFDLHHEFGRIIEVCDRLADDTLRRTLARLPVDVLEFALDQCAFASVGDGIRAQTLPPVGRWLILLGDGEQLEAVVAHEIAHAFLGHESPNTDAQEQEVRDLVRSWGFS